MNIPVGSFVTVLSNSRGIGKLTSISPDKQFAQVTYFHSIHKQETLTYPVKEVKATVLKSQTRCYYYFAKEERWIMGRALRVIDREYEVDFPDTFSKYIPEKDLLVRCEDSVPIPTDVLSILGQETAFFHIRRTNFLMTLMEQRAAAKGMAGLISSNISLMPHQVEVVRRVLEDPVPRYLLADEVGLGKTIETGVILRQMLLDDPRMRALVIVPSFLITQWNEELKHRFQIEQFEGRVEFTSVELFHSYSGSYPDIVIIDEAHEVAKLGLTSGIKEKGRYEQLKLLCHRAHVLLLLSATPVLNNEHEFLSMLHLLDPDNYKLDELDAFRRKVTFRQEVGKSLLSFREDSKPFMLKRGISNLRSRFNNDPILESHLVELEIGLDRFGEEERRDLIRRIRVHISETYRLHRRMLRNRRENVQDLFRHSRGENKVTEEFDLDERTVQLHKLLDEYRYEAWAAERELWKEVETRESVNFRIWLTLIEAAGCDEDLFQKVVNTRRAKKVERSLDGVFPDEILTLLASSPYFLGELELLDRMIEVFKYPSEEGDKKLLLLEIIKSIQDKSFRNREIPKKIIIFTQFTRVCEDLLEYLRHNLGTETVGAYHSGMEREEIEFVTNSFQNNQSCEVLICDSTGEVGRNFQFADHMIHYDLPLSPNRLEQRIGRLDRLGRTKPFQMSVLTGPDATVNFQFAWHNLMDKGLDIYRSSISSLQFFVDKHMPTILRCLYVHGIEGLEVETENIRLTIQEEKVNIAEQQVIDEIDARENQATSFLEQLVSYERNPQKIQDSVEPWICEALKFDKIRGTHFSQVLYEGTPSTLVPRSHLQTLHDQMNIPGCFSREQSIDLKNTKLFRIGEPFFDTLSEYLRWDDRGQTYAFWRTVPSWRGRDQDWLGFRLHYIVEGDTEPLNSLISSRGDDNQSKAYRRLLDKFFEPTYISILLDYQGNIANSTYRDLLETPFFDVEEGGNDTNIIKERLGRIRSTFSSGTWENICQKAAENSHRYLLSDTSFQELCKQNTDRARSYFGYMKTQLELRNNYESMWGKKEVFDDELYEVILKGIENPKVHLDAAGFLVLSDKPLRKQTQRGGGRF
ncbi:protein DpdE [Brevibacillus fluminis]|uniref:protein DpdE n=1 Tax=Brevibacillus fluminis TaxID=511487 RepID=UPI0016061DC7|nr:protein DpdE [Brevibacillus fluminis]